MKRKKKISYYSPTAQETSRTSLGPIFLVVRYLPCLPHCPPAATFSFGAFVLTPMFLVVLPVSYVVAVAACMPFRPCRINVT